MNPREFHARSQRLYDLTKGGRKGPFNETELVLAVRELVGRSIPAPLCEVALSASHMPIRDLFLLGRAAHLLRTQGQAFVPIDGAAFARYARRRWWARFLSPAWEAAYTLIISGTRTSRTTD